MRCANPPVRCYLAEVFAPHNGAQAGRVEADRIRAATAALAADGAPVRFLYSVFVPGDEAAMHLLVADRRATVELALRAAGLEADRISPAIAVAGKQSGETAAPAIPSSSRSLPRR
jgi:hypothetical protein